VLLLHHLACIPLSKSANTTEKKPYASRLGRLLGLLGAGLVGADLEVLAALDGELHLVLALLALHSEGDLLGGLGLLLEDGLGLTTVTLLLAVVPSTTGGLVGGLTSLVLGDLVDGCTQQRGQERGR
jgi:hypothetical protein